MPSDIRLTDFLRWFKRYGVVMTPGKGSHFIMTRVHDGVYFSYPVPTVNGRYVKFPYLAKARKALRLDAESGVSDEEFLA
jgi:hypothetical protein